MMFKVVVIIDWEGGNLLRNPGWRMKLIYLMQKIKWTVIFSYEENARMRNSMEN